MKPPSKPNRERERLKRLLLTKGQLPRAFFTQRRTESRRKSYREALEKLSVKDRRAARRIWG